MADDNYWNSSLLGEEIEARLLNAVRGDVAQNKSSAWKETARQNIGAFGESSIDKTLSVAGKSADASVTGLAISSSSNSSNAAFKCIGYDNNLLEWEQGGINRNTGVNASSATVIRTSNYFDIEDVFNFHIEIPSGYRVVICRYDAEYVYVSDTEYKNTTSIHVNTRTTSGRYYRFLFAEDSQTPRNIYPQEGELMKLKAYQSEDSLVKLAVSSEYLNVTVPLEKVAGVNKFPGNLFVPGDTLDNYYINTNNGKRISQVGYYASGWIPVIAGTTYRSNVGRNYAWYDSSRTYISGANGTSIQSGITAPENAAYIRFTINKSTDTSDLFDVYFTNSANYNNFVTIPHLIADNKPWCYGKTINWIGDSIVDGPDFDEYVCNALGLTKLTVDYNNGDLDAATGGINGSTIAVNPEVNPYGDGGKLIKAGRTPLCLRYDRMPENADIIAVSCGTNDFQYAWCGEIGNINAMDDGTENTKFYGALKTLCRGLVDRYPGKLIFFTTPIKRAQPFVNGAGGNNTSDFATVTPFSMNKFDKTLGDYADIIKEVCGLYSIPVLDMYRESLLNPHLTSGRQFFASEHDTVDGTRFDYWTHPNASGQKIMARRIAGWITQLGYGIE